MPEMLAIIPLYKRQDQLDRCLTALTASTLQTEPFVHDNSTNNLGFTKASNLGLRESLRRGHTYALLLNQDCYVQPDAIANLVAFMNAHPRCAIAGVKQLKADDPNQIIHGGCTDAHPAGRHLVGQVSNGDCAVSLPMPWVNGACWIVRLAAVTEVGLMDEGFFLIASDSDYCFTVRQRGWEVWYCADATVLHETGGVSSMAPTLEHLSRIQNDQLRFRDKWVGTPGWELLRAPPPTRTATAEEIQGALERAQQHYAKGELIPAELLCRHVLTYSPDLPDALLVLGRTLTREGLSALAARELMKVTSAIPDSPSARVALGDALILSGQPDLAVAEYTRARELGIDTPDIHNNLGVALHRAGQPESAVAAWRHALVLDPANAVARKNLQDVGVTDLPPAPMGSAPAGQPNPQAASHNPRPRRM